MQLESLCDCGNNKFFIITEKMYEGYLNEKGVLICEPDEQHINNIKCSTCGKEYTVHNFKEIEY